MNDIEQRYSTYLTVAIIYYHKNVSSIMTMKPLPLFFFFDEMKPLLQLLKEVELWPLG